MGTSDTAVLSVRGTQGNTIDQIKAVDGIPTTCWEVGCPWWVRVAPGGHTFTVSYTIMNNGITSYLRGETEVSLPDMKPKHVYEVRFLVSPDQKFFKGVPIDLGESPDYGVMIRATYHRVEF